ncbi:MAG: hypothetical protein LAT54_06020 [Cryomorphaceae bacterium]|nr:hypothetical protein [Cryomorphaceae bacterium]
MTSTANKLLSTLIVFLMIGSVATVSTSCKSFKPPGEEVTGPFDGRKYQSNNRYFRATGQAISQDANTSKTRSMTNAKARLAGTVSSTMRTVADEYTQEKGIANAGEFMERYEVLSREVVNQTIADIRTIGERTFRLENGRFQTYTALEIRKRHMYRHMRRLAEARRDWNDDDRKAFYDLLDYLESEAE